MIHVCKIVVTPGVDRDATQEAFTKKDECGEPATRCIVCHDSESPVTVWLCEEHYNDPMLRKFYESIWTEVDY